MSWRGVWITLAILSVSSTGNGQSPPSDTVPTSPGSANTATIPAAKLEKTYRIDKERAMFLAIQDDAPFPWTASAPRDDELRTQDDLEARAYDEVLQIAHQIPGAELEKASRKDVLYRDLMQPCRASFKLDLVHMEGRLRRLRRIDPTPAQKESGIENVYEAWIFPKDESNPICAFVTELAPGLSPQITITGDAPSPWVAVDGYSFKLLRYDSSERDPTRPDRFRIRRAPVLIGHTLGLVMIPPVSDGGLAWRETFMPVVILGFTSLALILVGVTLWYRHGDRHVRARINENQQRNPFDTSTAESA